MPPPFLLSPLPYLWLHCLWDDSIHLWDPPALQASISLSILFSSHRGLWMLLPLHLASLLLPQMRCSARSLISGLDSSSHFSPALGWFRALRQDAILPICGLCLLWLHACPPSLPLGPPLGSFSAPFCRPCTRSGPRQGPPRVSPDEGSSLSPPAHQTRRVQELPSSRERPRVRKIRDRKSVV